MMKLYFSITITAFFVISRVNSVNSTNNKCQGSCVTGNSTRFLPFPFGFSSGCPVQLNCSSSTGFEIGGFRVLNVTSTDIILDLPAKCGRQLASLVILFGENYAPSAANHLLLENCSKALQAPCEISSTFLERSFKLKPCFAKSDNMSCFTGRNGGQLLSFDEVNNTHCRSLFSSTTILADPASDSAFSLEMGRVNLEWWVKGECNCDANASCRKVENGDKTVGFRCLCREGFDGDGFKEGRGCRRVSKCNASKFMSGRCGTRVGVLVGGLVVGALLMGGVVLLCCYVRRCCNSSNKQMNAKRRLCEAAGNTSVPFYGYREIERATDGFSDKHRLGTGAYGTVYAGKLHNDELVAIKRFRYRDPDSIDQHLQRERGEGLPWTVRLNIATETAKAIAYLHSVNPPIFHRDIKSSNIIQGTPGYLDPQYHQYFHLSDKSDVYSFGVVLIEIITALKVVDFSRPHCEVNLAALATDRIGRGRVDEMIDPYLDLHGDAWTLSSIHNVAELAFRCLSFHPDMRPTMLEVEEELERMRLSAWVPCMCIESPSASSCPSSDDESETSSSTKTVVERSMIVKSQRLVVKQMGGNYSTSFDGVKTNSPVSVQDHWLSEQSSPSTNSLLGNASQRE
ncbi:hypothetical protein V6N11_076619 [Hibiscus sabdariffa]|uniref:Protein kinase domain-containing protein n=1 Tax=Hibiscus sabdariffa TaxID=183260 RepID=A0ABR2Q6T8_9ROSI